MMHTGPYLLARMMIRKSIFTEQKGSLVHGRAGKNTHQFFK
jgi:hypothetical protein